MFYYNNFEGMFPIGPNSRGAYFVQDNKENAKKDRNYKRINEKIIYEL